MLGDGEGVNLASEETKVLIERFEKEDIIKENIVTKDTSEKNVEKSDIMPNTLDETRIGLWILVMILSGLGLKYIKNVKKCTHI